MPVSRRLRSQAAVLAELQRGHIRLYKKSFGHGRLNGWRLVTADHQVVRVESRIVDRLQRAGMITESRDHFSMYLTKRGEGR